MFAVTELLSTLATTEVELVGVLGEVLFETRGAAEAMLAVRAVVPVLPSMSPHVIPIPSRGVEALSTDGTIVGTLGGERGDRLDLTPSMVGTGVVSSTTGGTHWSFGEK